MSFNTVTGGKAKAGGYTVGDGCTMQTKILHVYPNAVSSEQDSDFDLPVKSFVTHADFNVLVTTAASSACTLHVGLLSTSSGGDADGFLASIPVDTTGLKTGTITVSTSGSLGYFYSANTFGQLIYANKVGTTGAADVGYAAPRVHSADSVTARSVSYTLASTESGVANGEMYVTINYHVVER